MNWEEEIFVDLLKLDLNLKYFKGDTWIEKMKIENEYICPLEFGATCNYYEWRHVYEEEEDDLEDCLECMHWDTSEDDFLFNCKRCPKHSDFYQKWKMLKPSNEL